MVTVNGILAFHSTSQQGRVTALPYSWETHTDNTLSLAQGQASLTHSLPRCVAQPPASSTLTSNTCKGPRGHWVPPLSTCWLLGSCSALALIHCQEVRWKHGVRLVAGAAPGLLCVASTLSQDPVQALMLPAWSL